MKSGIGAIFQMWRKGNSYQFFFGSIFMVNNIQKQSCNSIAIIFIGTGNYFDFFPKYYETSKELFLPQTTKEYFVFTEHVNATYLKYRDDITVIPTEAEKWPFSTLHRYRYIASISEHLQKHTYTIFIDADMYIHATVTEEEFFSHDKPLFGVQHPGCLDGGGPFEQNQNSRAYVGENYDLSTYWQGCFWGGGTREILDMSRMLARRIDDDLSRGVIAKWHDESHLNKYFAENKERVHTYHPGYAYAEILEGKLHFDKKIVHLIKDHKQIREI